MATQSFVQPAVALDFTSASLDPRITFTRADATATRVNSTGFIETVAADTPRFDYDSVSLACKGLLIEEARTNSNVQSNFAGSWTNLNSNTNIVNWPGTAPDGTTSASALKRFLATNTNNVVHQLQQYGKTLTSGTAYTASCFFTRREHSIAIVVIYDTTDGESKCYFDVLNGAVLTVAAGCTATITPYKNGWHRCSVTKTVSASSGGMAIGFTNADNTPSFSAALNSGLFIFGAQLEAGAFPTSYIPTTTTALTRNADVATITGTNFSDFWQATHGGVLVRALPSTVSGTRPLIQFDDGTANEIIALRGNTTNPELYIVDGGAPQAQIDAGTIAANTAYSLTGWWQANFCAARKDNSARVEDLTATIPTVDQMRIGSDGTNYLNGHLATISYYDQFSGEIYTRRKNKAVFSVL
jgi:hypothetical protein